MQSFSHTKLTVISLHSIATILTYHPTTIMSDTQEHALTRLDRSEQAYLLTLLVEHRRVPCAIVRSANGLRLPLGFWPSFHIVMERWAIALQRAKVNESPELLIVRPIVSECPMDVHAGFQFAHLVKGLHGIGALSERGIEAISTEDANTITFQDIVRILKPRQNKANEKTPVNRVEASIVHIPPIAAPVKTIAQIAPEPKRSRVSPAPKPKPQSVIHEPKPIERRNATAPPAVKRSCASCAADEPCSEMNCTITPSQAYVQTPDRTRAFVCTEPFGHLCGRHRIDAENKNLSASRFPIKNRNGDTLFHICMRRCAFSIHTRQMGTVTIDATKHPVTGSCIPPRIIVAPSQVKLLVCLTANGEFICKLRVGRTSTHVLWDADYTSCVLTKRSVHMNLEKHEFTFTDTSGNTHTLRCKDKLISCKTLPAICSRSSTSANIVFIYQTNEKLPTTSEGIVAFFVRSVVTVPPRLGIVDNAILTAGSIRQTLDITIASLELPVITSS